MKRNALSTAIAAVVTLAIIAGAQRAQAAQCSLANVAGTYGYTSQGTIIANNIGPFAAVGRVEFGPGHSLSGSQQSSFGGVQVAETVSGSFYVNPDCTGKANINVTGGVPRSTTLKLVWDDQRNQIRAIFLTTGAVVTIEARRIDSGDE